MNFTKGQVLNDRYELLEFLGRGGFSVVWLAEDSLTHTRVAIKIYAPDKGLDQDGLEQFKKEFRRTRNLRHPHLLVPDYFDILKESQSPFLIMPYCSHGSLGKLAYEEEEITEQQVARIMAEIGSGLKELHANRVIHQDIKPDNILIHESGKYMLTDFGISRNMRSTLKKATANQSYMTAAYSPPERYIANPVDSPASDIFSLGVMMYELCTGRVPWDGMGGMVLNSGAAVPNLAKEYPGRLNVIIKACMRKDYSRRPSAADLEQIGKAYLATGSWPLYEEGMESESPAASESSSRRTRKMEQVSDNAFDIVNDESGLGQQTQADATAGGAREGAGRHSEEGSTPFTRALSVGVVLAFVCILGFIAYRAMFPGIPPEVLEEFNDYRTMGDTYVESGMYDMAMARYGRALQLRGDIPGKDSVQKAFDELRSWIDWEQEVWNLADAGKTVALYQDYLENFPDGGHVNEAEKAIADIRDQQAKARRLEQQKRARQEEDNAWATAQRIGTIESYRDYLSSYSNGRYAGSARNKIEEIERNRVERKTITYNNGDKYEGDIKNNQRHGQGTYTWGESGTIYIGTWVEGKRTGQGRLIWTSGARYIGEFKDNEIVGEGKYFYGNGDMYDGSLLNGKRHGQGVYTVARDNNLHILNAPDCKRYDGQWRDNKKQGFGRCYDKDGRLLYAGQFYNDKPVDTYPNR